MLLILKVTFPLSLLLLLYFFYHAEKKLLQSKLWKVSMNGKDDSKKTSTGKDVSTSTEDLGAN